MRCFTACTGTQTKGWEFQVTVRNDGRGGFEVIRVDPEYCPR